MNYYTRLHNSLILRRLLPPPILLCSINKKSLRSANTPLLHQAFASCGRFSCAIMLLLALGLSSCECGEAPVDAEQLTRTLADSTAADSAVGLTIEIDTAWAGVYNYTY